MNNWELISRLQETSQALEQLAQHLSAMEQPAAETVAATESEEAAETAPEPLPEASTETAADLLSENEKPENSAENEETPEITDIIIETTFEPIEEAASEYKSSQAEEKQNANAQANNPANNNPFAKIVNNLLSKPLPNAANMSGFNPLQMLTGGLGGMPNLNGLAGLPGLSNLPGLNQQSLPTTLAELHDNPQLLGMLKNVSNNPQMLNMLAGLTGQDAQTLQQTLQSLQPNAAAPTAAAAPINTNVNPMAENAATAAAPQTMPNIPMGNINPLNTATMPPIPNPTDSLPATPYLDSLLAEWHWQPYARAWTF